LPKPSRKQLILETLAQQLESHPGDRITTASLAKAVGVSEAALYRHFASKAKMFEGLIAFAEEAIFARINLILEEEKNTEARCAQVLHLMLGFADRNPGIARVLLGDALVGERDRLLERVQQFFERLEVQLKQILRESALRKDVGLSIEPDQAASLLTAFIEGRLQQFQRSRFSNPSLENWDSDWALIKKGLFNH